MTAPKGGATKPVWIELLGPSGSGKTTVMHEVLKLNLSAGIAGRAGIEVATRSLQARLKARLSRTLFHTSKRVKTSDTLSCVEKEFWASTVLAGANDQIKDPYQRLRFVHYFFERLHRHSKMLAAARELSIRCVLDDGGIVHNNLGLNHDILKKLGLENRPSNIQLPVGVIHLLGSLEWVYSNKSKRGKGSFLELGYDADDLLRITQEDLIRYEAKIRLLSNWGVPVYRIDAMRNAPHVAKDVVKVIDLEVVSN